MNTRTSFQGLAIALAAGALLAGCVPLMVGGAAVVGVGMIATDRRSSGAQLDDQGIELRGAARIREIANDNMNVTVTSYNRQVLLTGEVPNEADKQTAERAVAAVENVKSVVNDLVVGPPASLSTRSSDLLVASKIKATFVDARDVFAGAFKVVVTRGTAYLMGRVTQREADRATQLTRTVGGVQRVVRVFEIITEAELRYEVPPAAPPVRDPASAPGAR